MELNKRCDKVYIRVQNRKDGLQPDRAGNLLRQAGGCSGSVAGKARGGLQW